MPLVLGGSSVVAEPYSVDYSCRFDKASSAFLNLTFATPTNGHIWNFSCWVKRTNLGTGTPLWNPLFCDAGSPDCRLYFRDDDWRFDGYHSGGAYAFQTTQLFRDVSAWYHVCILWDDTQATPADRAKLFINGTQVTAFAVDDPPDQDSQHSMNTAIEHYIGRIVASQYTDCYMAQVCFIDGTVYTVSDFGEFNSDSPTVWQPIDVSELTFGNNGFLLDFADSADLGNDVSGKGNDWASNGLAATDQCVDTPTNNFATLNPLDNKFYATTFTEGNLKMTPTSGQYTYNTSTIKVANGKWYVEVKATDEGNSVLGIVDKVSTSTTNELGYNDYGWEYKGHNGQVRGGAAAGTLIDTYNTYDDGDIVGIYLDLDNNKLYFAKNGTLEDSGTGLDITAAASTGQGSYFFAGGDAASSSATVFEFNFGSPSYSISSGNADANGYGNFEYDPSAGSFDSASKDFYALCTKNLAEYG